MKRFAYLAVILPLSVLFMLAGCSSSGKTGRNTEDKGKGKTWYTFNLNGKVKEFKITEYYSEEMDGKYVKTGKPHDVLTVSFDPDGNVTREIDAGMFHRREHHFKDGLYTGYTSLDMESSKLKSRWTVDEFDDRGRVLNGHFEKYGDEGKIRRTGLFFQYYINDLLVKQTVYDNEMGLALDIVWEYDDNRNVTLEARDNYAAGGMIYFQYEIMESDNNGNWIKRIRKDSSGTREKFIRLIQERDIKYY